MKRLQPLVVDDFNIVRTLAKNAQLSSHPALENILTAVIAQYESYSQGNGDAHLINPPLPISPELGSALRKHYKNEVVGLEFIRLVREKISPDVCPLCGGFSPTTVDHVLPKEDYPEFSFFSQNLVPACDCNTKKGRSYKGEEIGKRVLHPYYDDILSNRLLYVSFEGELSNPSVALRPLLAYANNVTLNFHLEYVLNKTNIINWAIKKWSNLLRSPKSVLPNLRYHPAPYTPDIVTTCVEQLLESKDDEMQTPNNWESMFLYGLSVRPEASNFISEKINFILANPDVAF